MADKNTITTMLSVGLLATLREGIQPQEVTDAEMDTAATQAKEMLAELAAEVRKAAFDAGVATGRKEACQEIATERAAKQWEQRAFIATAAMQGLLAAIGEHLDLLCLTNSERLMVTDQAVLVADQLIERLQGDHDDGSNDNTTGQEQEGLAKQPGAAGDVPGGGGDSQGGQAG